MCAAGQVVHFSGRVEVSDDGRDCLLSIMSAVTVLCVLCLIRDCLMCAMFARP